MKTKLDKAILDSMSNNPGGEDTWSSRHKTHRRCLRAAQRERMQDHETESTGKRQMAREGNHSAGGSGLGDRRVSATFRVAGWRWGRSGQRQDHCGFVSRRRAGRRVGNP